MAEVTHAQLADRIEALEAKLDKIATDVSATKDLVEALAAIKAFGRFAKWAGGIIMTVGGAYAVMKGWLAGGLK